MNNVTKRILSMLLMLSMLVCAAVPAFAAGKDEEYLADLRLIYAEDYKEAAEILADSEFKEYKLLNENLNHGTGEIGVWLAYKTTTDIEDAITDIAVMQMDGGYNEGSYRDMIQKSEAEYLAMGEIYMQAVEYFAQAYDAEDFLAVSAYRQLNFYAGLDDYEEDLLGELMVDGVLSSADLATMFFQGNSYVLKNVRSLLAMGVSYNEDGKHYLEKVGESAAAMNADPNVFANEGYEELAAVLVPTLTVFRDMFDELSAYEADMDFTDDEMTELELKYVEYKAFAEMLRAVEYLEGETLYAFVMRYRADESDYSALYPLVDALNEGQVALVKVSHYYDVVRYSMSDYPEEMMNEEISKLEEEYSENPFDIYAGVDRSIYDGVFALTSAAYRADAYTDGVSLAQAMFGNGAWMMTTVQFLAAPLGAGLSAYAIKRTMQHMDDSKNALLQAQEAADDASFMLGRAMKTAENNVGAELFQGYTIPGQDPAATTLDDIISNILSNADPEKYDQAMLQGMDFGLKFRELSSEAYMGNIKLSDSENRVLEYARIKIEKARNHVAENPPQPELMGGVSTVSKLFTGALYVLGGAALIYSVVSITMQIYDYYHPAYDAIPMAMVDLIDTEDGDRYIKYDVVCEAVAKPDGSYAAADLNAFEAQRWNALYYTKSYEAGKPLLADEFIISTVSNVPAKNHMPVHRFGEVVCYNLNKYNFNDDQSIYLSIKQSENQKSAVADVPGVVGSLFSTGYYFLAAGIGLMVGVGGTIGAQAVVKKKKSKA